MIIAKLTGGMGNQMFQYAAGRRLAIHHGTELKLDLSDYRSGTDRRSKGLEQFARKYALEAFQIKAKEATVAEVKTLRDPYLTQSSTRARVVRLVRKWRSRFLWPSTHYQEREFQFESAVLTIPDNMYLSGFWQSPKYFADVAEEIRRDFAHRDPDPVDQARRFLSELRSDGAPAVSVHVRRGDLAHAVEQLKQRALVCGAPVGLEYVKAAMGRFDKACHFIVFSDTAADIDWCKQHLRGPRVHYSTGRSDLEDAALMSACDHHIIANSTFSWWSAWLDCKPGRRVIAPGKWGYSDAKFQMVTDDLIPPDWEIL